MSFPAFRRLFPRGFFAEVPGRLRARARARHRVSWFAAV